MTLTAAPILIVEDDELSCELLQRRLENDGYDISTASTAKEALELINTSKFELVLLDIMLPDMNGDVVLKKIKSNPNLTKTQVIMVSANGEREMVLKCIDDGAIDYLIKPFSMTLASLRISRCLKNANIHTNSDENIYKDSKILIADDQELNRDVLAHRLKKSGYHISSYDNGHDTLNALKNDTFDLILLDIMMPDISGIDVLKEIRQFKNNTPIIMLTAIDDIETIDECIVAGADDYILKPVNTTLLKLRISSCLH